MVNYFLFLCLLGAALGIGSAAAGLNVWEMLIVAFGLSLASPWLYEFLTGRKP